MPEREKCGRIYRIPKKQRTGILGHDFPTCIRPKEHTTPHSWLPENARYCGSKFPHRMHSFAMIGRPEVVFHCGGKGQ